MEETIAKALITIISLFNFPVADIDTQPKEIIEEPVLVQEYSLELRAGDASEFNYYLVSHEGEEDDLDVFGAALSHDKNLLATIPYDSFKLTVKDLENDKIIFNYTLPGSFEGLSGISWSPNDKYLAFTSTYLSSYGNRKTKYILIDVYREIYYLKNLPIAFHVGSNAYPEPLVWSPNSEKVVTVTYPGANQYDDFHDFTVINKNGSTSRTIGIPNEKGEYYGVWPEKYRFSEDMTSIEYRFMGEEEWKKVNIN